MLSLGYADACVQQGRMVKHQKKFAEGQTAVIMTLVIGVLLGAMALCTDVGLFYFNWMQLQKAADAAALAGANQLTAVPDPSGTVAANAVSTAEGYACLNGINDPNNTNPTICPNPVQNASYVDQVASTNVDPNDTQLSIKLTRQVPYFFARVLGLNSGSVAAAATAQVGQGVNTFNNGLFPAGIQCDKPCSSIANMDPGQSVVFGQKFAGGLAPGNWQWLDLGQGTGASDLSNAIANGVAGTYSIGENISSTSGTNYNSSVVQDGFQARVNEHNSKFPAVDYTKVCGNGGNPNNIPLDDPLLITVPVVDFGGCSGDCTMAIEGFADVYLTAMSVDKSGNATIDGCFVQEVTAGSVGSASAPVLGALSKPILIQ
jgi:Flp pilus assembly protein TadG